MSRNKRQHVVEIKTMAYESRLPTFEFSLCYLLAL